MCLHSGVLGPGLSLVGCFFFFLGGGPSLSSSVKDNSISPVSTSQAHYEIPFRSGIKAVERESAEQGNRRPSYSSRSFRRKQEVVLKVVLCGCCKCT